MRASRSGGISRKLAIEFLVADEEAGVQDGLAPVRALDRALEDAGAHQREEAVDQQLRAAVEADLERSELGVRRQRRAERGQQRAELSVPGVAQDQGMRECIGERADADLQRAAVLDQGGRVQRHGVVRERDRLLGRGEQVIVRRRRLEHHVDLVAEFELGLARHVGEVGVELDRERQRLTRPPTAQHVVTHVERDVGIRAQADARLPAGMWRRQLGKAIGADARQMGGDLRVVEARVALLHAGVAGPGSRLQEELGHLDIGRQAAAAQRRDVGDVGVAAEQAREQRLDEAALERRAVGGTNQGEAGEDAQAQAAVGLRQSVERVDEMHRLADADGHGEGDIAPGAVDDRLGAADGIARAERQTLILMRAGSPAPARARS